MYAGAPPASFFPKHWRRAGTCLSRMFLYIATNETRTSYAEEHNLNVRVSGALGEFVAANVGESGAYENVSEYVRDLIRRDMQRSESEAFERLRAELARAFAAPDSAYKSLDAEAVIARNAARKAR